MLHSLPHSKEKIVCTYFILFVMYFFADFSNVYAQQNIEPFQILFLSSFDSASETVVKQIDGIKDLLSNSSSITELYVNITATSEGVYSSELIHFMTSQLNSSNHFDAIILSDNEILRFVIAYQKIQPIKIPTLFLGIDDVELASQAIECNFSTGIISIPDILSTIDLIQCLQPNVKTLVVVGDESPRGRLLYEQYSNISEKYKNINFEYVNSSQLTKEELKEYITQLSSKDVILYLSITTDRNGEIYNLSPNDNFLLECANNPVYSCGYGEVGNGLLGGNIISSYKSGQLVGQMIQDVMAGQTISSIAPITNAPCDYIFDYEMLLKYEIDLENLPSFSSIVNKRINFFEKYSKFIIPAFMSLTAISIILAILLILRLVRYNRSRQRL